MNKKTIFLIFITLMFIIICSSFVFAKYYVAETQLLNNKDIVNINDIYEKVDLNNMKGDNNSKILNKKDYVDLGNSYLTNLKLTDKKINEESYKIEVYNNNLLDMKEVILYDDNIKITLDAETNKIVSFVSNKIDFPKNLLSKEQVEPIAMSMLNNFRDEGEYTLISLNEFDDEIYQAKFAKKYGEYINIGELISFSFSPQTKEILTFAKKNMTFANNEIKLSKEEAELIAKNFLNKSVATDIESMSIEIVMPNNTLKQPLSDGNLYKSAKQTRLAYVITLNNDNKNKIYIDCTTGEIIGSEIILGGEL